MKRKSNKLPRVFLQRNRLIKKTPGEIIVNSIVFILFSIYAFLLIYLIVYLLFNSLFLTGYWYGEKIDNPNAHIEYTFTFQNYVDALKVYVSDTRGFSIYLPEMFFNSMWYCFIGVSAGVLMSTFTGYVIAKYEFKGRNVIYAIAIFCMTIPIIGTTSSMLKLVNSDYLPIYNTPFYVLLTSLGGFGFNFMVMHAFFKNVSWNYVEAVLIDGGGHYTAFFKVMLPQAHSSIVTLVILALIGSWNDYSTPMMFLPDYPTVASGIYTITKSNQRSDNMPKLFAGLVLSFIPALILFSIFSDRIMKNFSIGGLKG